MSVTHPNGDFSRPPGPELRPGWCLERSRTLHLDSSTESERMPAAQPRLAADSRG